MSPLLTVGLLVGGIAALAAVHGLLFLFLREPTPPEGAPPEE
jgi:hypothetical protein